MNKLILSLTILLAGAMSSANTTVQMVSELVRSTVNFTGMDVKVGDHAEYNVDIGGFIKGTNKMSVTQDLGTEFWLTQNMDLGFAGKQLIEALIDKNTGQVKQLKVNGQPQDPPKSDGYDVISMDQADITVPAGTFKSVHVKVKQKSDGSMIEQWVNPQQIPIGGSIKSIVPSQYGTVNTELTSFGKGN